jgi:hypothetical protein
MASIKKRGGRYTVRYRANGSQHRKTFGRYEDARRFSRDVEKARDDGSYIDPARGKVTMQEAFERFLESP